MEGGGGQLVVNREVIHFLFITLIDLHIEVSFTSIECLLTTLNTPISLKIHHRQ